MRRWKTKGGHAKHVVTSLKSYQWVFQGTVSWMVSHGVENTGGSWVLVQTNIFKLGLCLLTRYLIVRRVGAARVLCSAAGAMGASETVERLAKSTSKSTFNNGRFQLRRKASICDSFLQ